MHLHRVILLLTFALTGFAVAADDTPATAHGHLPPGATGSFKVTVPAQAFDIVLARPEAQAMTVSVLAYQELEGYIAYGLHPGTYTLQTPLRQFQKGEPAAMALGALQADTTYYYQFRSRAPGATQFNNAAEGTFHTARPVGSSFTFTLTADVHLDEHTSPLVYRRTLSNIRADAPDFHIDLGNMFMTDKHGSRDEAAQQYLAQRYYLGQLGGSVPLLLALGTHDGESGKYDDGSADCLAVWANLMRTRYFPDPLPDDFYSGNHTPAALRGLPQNYFAWRWGDALFVVLDPFQHSLPQRDGDGWGWTLGKTQYQWLAQTLAQSPAKFKFVFIHNLLSGDQTARGGVEVAGFNEWGGKNSDGTDGFAQHRPGWDAPIQQLLWRNHVTAVFKAHDNFYARQELDGIVYQMVPQPSFAGNDRIRDLPNYGYKLGKFLGNSGHVRVTVSPEQVKVDYVRSYQPDEETDQQKNGGVAFSYTIPAGHL